MQRKRKQQPEGWLAPFEFAKALLIPRWETVMVCHSKRIS